MMAETVSRTFDQMILGTLLGNAHKLLAVPLGDQSPGGVEWVSFERGESQGTYADDFSKAHEQPGYAYHYYWRDKFEPPPAESLVIEGECREVGLKELPPTAYSTKEIELWQTSTLSYTS